MCAHNYIISTACVRMAPNRVQYAISVEHYQPTNAKPISQSSVVLSIAAYYGKVSGRTFFSYVFMLNRVYCDTQCHIANFL